MFEHRKRYRDVMEEFDRFIDEMARDVEKMVRNTVESGMVELSRPMIYGLTMRLGPGGEPIIRTFGDKVAKEGGLREPVADQFVDEARGELKLFVELPGIEKEDIRLESSEDQLTLAATRGERRYQTNIVFKKPVDPNNAIAVCYNGVLEATFKLRGKDNKEFRSITID